MVNKSYKDYYILLTTLIKIKDNLRTTAPRKEKKKKLPKIEEKREKSKKKFSTALSEKELETPFETTEPEIKPKAPPATQTEPISKQILLNEATYESSFSSAKTSLNGALIKVEFNDKKDLYINPSNTLVLTNSKVSSSSDADGFVQIYHEDNEFDKVLDDFYNLE